MSEEKDMAGINEESLKPDAVQETPEIQEKTEEAPKSEIKNQEITEDESVVSSETVTTESTVSSSSTNEVQVQPELAQNDANSITTPTVKNTKDDKEDDNHEELHADEHEEEIDYSTLPKESLLEEITKLSKEENGYKKGKTFFAIKNAYDAIFNNEKELALSKFIEDGGDKDDFEYKLDEVSTNFDAYYKLIKDRRFQNGKELEKQKEKNLVLKNDLLEKLRELVHNDESTSSIKDLKSLQEEWKAIGPVHPQHNKTLWANYNALLDQYYDNRSIYFELKELDKKKNLEKKLTLCDQAEALDGIENLNEAIKKLNEYHEEYKHLGPVPKEVQEETWQRFKAASDKVYAKRKDYFNKLKDSFNENLNKKVLLVEKIKSFEGFTSDKIGEWNKTTKEVLAIQKEWESIGSMPKEKAKEINRNFWGAFKGFFHNKSAFFKTLDSQREENLEKKKVLVQQAQELSQNEDWNATANKLKDLQKSWKDIGPVPDKQRESIYQEFKSACDEFFNRRRGHNKELESSYDGNLDKKQAICEALENLVNSDKLDTEKVYELQDEYNNIGFVPKNAIKKIQNRYQAALKSIVENSKGLSHEEIEEMKSLIFVHKIQGGPNADQKIQRKEYSLKKKIQHLEGEVSTWKNNIGFFSSSKNANSLIKDFEEKIAAAESQLSDLKEELKFLSKI